MSPQRKSLIGRLVLALLFGAALFWAAFHDRGVAPSDHAAEPFRAFGLFHDPAFSSLERGALLAVLAVAVIGLLYALLLVRQVFAAERGTASMQEVAAAVREGSNAYLAAQFRRIGPLIVLITALLLVTYTGSEEAFR
jgi:K(+)-stimulated pyrophosphate-energized sodium pump